MTLARTPRRMGLALLSSVAAAIAAHAADTEPSQTPALRAAYAIRDGGGYEWKNSTGTPHEIIHDGQVVLAAQPHGTYCCGYTFAVAMDLCRQRSLLAGKSYREVKRFQKDWYGATEEAREKTCAYAVERLGVGREVARIADAQPGDFMQIWRINKSGHAVVLLELLRKHEAIVGIRYRSSQQLTDGVGDRTEYFADAPGQEGKLDRRRVYIARLNLEAGSSTDASRAPTGD
ncbi:MAG: hypothetical protein KDA61_19170 [Planctomycetales bacterium]|nr:hypothetical protein [Planctomycetales bacterium]